MRKLYKVEKERDSSKYIYLIKENEEFADILQCQYNLAHDFVDYESITGFIISAHFKSNPTYIEYTGLGKIQKINIYL